MAKVKIQGNASGTGVVTLTAPNTNSDRTITLPDEDITLGGGGGMEFISKTTVSSAVSSVDFTGLSDGNYELRVEGVMNTANLSYFRARVFNTSGTLLASTEYSYIQTVLTQSIPTSFAQNNTSLCKLTASVETSALTSGVINLSVDGNRKYLRSNMSSYTYLYYPRQSLCTCDFTTNKVTGLQFAFSSGNITSGTFSLYKIKES